MFFSRNSKHRPTTTFSPQQQKENERGKLLLISSKLINRWSISCRTLSISFSSSLDLLLFCSMAFGLFSVLPLTFSPAHSHFRYSVKCLSTVCCCCCCCLPPSKWHINGSSSRSLWGRELLRRKMGRFDLSLSFAAADLLMCPALWLTDSVFSYFLFFLSFSHFDFRTLSTWANSLARFY